MQFKCWGMIYSTKGMKTDSTKVEIRTEEISLVASH